MSFHWKCKGKACRYCQREAGGSWRSGGLPPETYFRTAPSRMLESALLEGGKTPSENFFFEKFFPGPTMVGPITDIGYKRMSSTLKVFARHVYSPLPTVCK